MRTYQKELVMLVSDQGIDKDTSSGVTKGLSSPQTELKTSWLDD